MAWDFKTKPELPNSMLEFYYWESPHKQIFEDFSAFVVRVHDGDTITLRCNFRDFDFPIRFLDIDAPELNAPRGHEVRDWLKKRIEGEEVDIIIDKKNRTEKWGRLLGKVMHRGMDMGDDMMRQGLVWPFGRRREGEIPNIKKELNIEKWV